MGIAVIGTEHEPFRYWAFISYSSSDARFARWLHKAIENYSIPVKLTNRLTPAGRPAPKRFRPLFHDRSELPASSNLGGQIEEALRQSSYLIVVCSPYAARSQWVNKEVETFQKLGGSDRILSVIVSGEPTYSGETQCFPPALLRTEPIAADARTSADGETNAKLKLIAGMLGVSFDELKQRDRKLRVRRIWMTTTAGAVLSLILGGLAGAAWWQRRATEHQREIATEQTRAAERQGEIASERTGNLRHVLDVITWNLDEQIDDIPGSLKVKADTLAGADDYLSQMTKDGPSDVGLLRDAAVTRSKLAGVKISMGRLSDARVSLESAVSLDRNLLSRDSNNGLYQLDLAADLKQYALLNFMQGDPRGAAQPISEAMTILRGMDAAIPIHEQVQYHLASAHLLSGLLAWDEGATDEAATEFTESSKLYESLVKASPKAVFYLSQLAELNSYLARMYRFSGTVERAESYCSRNMEFLKRLNDPSTSHTSAVKASVSGIYEMAETLFARGLLDEATTDTEDGLALIQDASKTDPQDASAQLVLAQGQILMGRILSTKGNIDQASEMFLGARAIGEELTRVDSSNAEGWAIQAIADGEIAMAYMKDGDTSNSARYARTFHAEVKALQTSGKVLTPALRQVLKEAEAARLQ